MLNRVYRPWECFVAAMIAVILLDATWWCTSGLLFPDYDDIRTPFTVIPVFVAAIGWLRVRSLRPTLAAACGAIGGAVFAFTTLFVVFLQVGS